MTITYETNLKDFEFWGEARKNISKLTDEELTVIDDYFDGIAYDRTEFNDLFAYGFDGICAILNLEEDEVLARP